MRLMHGQQLGGRQYTFLAVWILHPFQILTATLTVVFAVKCICVHLDCCSFSEDIYSAEGVESCSF